MRRRPKRQAVDSRILNEAHQGDAALEAVQRGELAYWPRAESHYRRALEIAEDVVFASPEDREALHSLISARIEKLRDHAAAYASWEQARQLEHLKREQESDSDHLRSDASVFGHVRIGDSPPPAPPGYWTQ